MDKKEDRVSVEWCDNKYFVRVEYDNCCDTYQVPQPCMTDKQHKAVMKFAKNFKMSEDERISMMYSIIKSLWRQCANNQAVYYASKFWIPEDKVHLVDFYLKDGKMIPTTDFWWSKNNG